jgi:hypothetical protein
MFLSDFQQWLMGQGGGQPGAQAPDQTANVAAPTLDQSLQSARVQQAMSHLGQFGATLMAAGQRMTPKERAAILANGAQYLDFSNDGMAAAKELASQMALQQTQREQQRKDELTTMFNSPDMLKKLGVTPEQAKVLGVDGMQKVYETMLSRDPVAQQKARLEMQKLQNEVSNYQTPDQVELTKKRADNLAKQEQDRYDKAQAEGRYADTYKKYTDIAVKAANSGAFGALDANPLYRATAGRLLDRENETIRQEMDRAKEEMKYAWLAKNYGKLDAKGITEQDLAMAEKAMLNLGSVNAGKQVSDWMAANKPTQQVSIPAGAVEKLRKFPNLAEAFDAKFGPGASKAVLGGK